nr:DUF2079 domain-containing protein [uncultured Acetatifactor sp.]
MKEKIASCLLKAFLTALYILSFLTGAIRKPDQLLTGFPFTLYILLFAVIGAICFWQYYSNLFVYRWGLPFALSIVFVAGIFSGSGGVLFTVAFLIYLSLPDGMHFTDKIKAVGKPAIANKRHTEKEERGCKWMASVVVLSGIAFVIVIGYLSTIKYMCFQSDRLDFGIFSQMFEQMRTSGLAITTCERGRSLSHFSIHLSPLLYILLPFYCCFPHPATLLWIQAAGLMLSIWPLVQLCRLHGLSGRAIGWLICAFVMYPALAGGCFFDFHENFLLTPFLLLFLYLAEKKNWIWANIAAVCICFIKEDAAIYLLCLCCYLTFHKDMRRQAIRLAVFSVAYFCIAVVLLSTLGEGTMAASRYAQYEAEGGGMISIAFHIFQNPYHVLWTAFQEDRWTYLLQMFLPLMVLPLIGIKKQEIFLLAPMFLFNLMTDYSYQHNIYYQYQFGTLALLFYMVVIRLGQLKVWQGRWNWHKSLLSVGKLAMCMAGLSLFVSVVFHRGQTRYLTEWEENRRPYSQMEQVLENVSKEGREGVKVAASKKLVAHLWQVTELYDTAQIEGDKSMDWILLDMRYADQQMLAEQYQAKGYQTRESIEGYLLWLSAEGRDL